MSERCYVYVMRCPLHKPGLVKIGFTNRDADVRRKELSKFSGVPMDFMILCRARFFGNGAVYEKVIHIFFDKLRVDKEFFQFTEEQVQAFAFGGSILLHRIIKGKIKDLEGFKNECREAIKDLSFDGNRFSYEHLRLNKINK